MPIDFLFAIYAPGAARTEIRVDQDTILIGRDERCAIRLDATAVEREHARLVLEGDQVRLEDLRSRTGTKVNGRRVTTHLLVPGDDIEVASFLIRVEPGRRAAGVKTPSP